MAWAREQSDLALSVISAGPVVEGGWRFGFGDRGIYIEPHAGYIALFGAIIPDLAPASFAITYGLFGGLSLGWIFKGSEGALP